MIESNRVSGDPTPIQGSQPGWKEGREAWSLLCYAGELGITKGCLFQEAGSVLLGNCLLLSKQQEHWKPTVSVWPYYWVTGSGRGGAG